MKIQYFAHIREITRVNEEEITQPFPTIRALVTHLCQRYGSGFVKWVLTPDGELSDLAIVLVNGNDVRHTGRLDTPIRPTDTICIFPPVAGG